MSTEAIEKKLAVARSKMVTAIVLDNWQKATALSLNAAKEESLLRARSKMITEIILDRQKVQQTSS